MPGPLFHVGGGAICPHGGSVSVISTNVRVLVSGQPVATVADTCMVAGCAFTIGTKPSPCLTVRWLTPAVRVLVNGVPALIQTSTGLCQSPEQAPQGPPTIVAAQPRAVAT